jgi:hypothetical protein
LISNERVARYLEQYQPELLIEFEKIADMTSTLPSALECPHEGVGQRMVP